MKTALITGASNGIGKEFAKIFAKEGYDLILVARNENKLRELSEMLVSQFNVKTTIIVQDLALSNSANILYQEITKKNISVDVLINNAGFGKIGLFLSMDVDSINEMINLNVNTLTQLTSLFLPSMIKKNKGKILNVASTAAFQSLPNFAVYGATKSFVLNFTEALHYELKETDISVTALCPGPTYTGFAKRANAEKSSLFKNAMDSKTVAQIGYQALMNNKMYVIVGFKNKFLAYASRFIPSRRWLVHIAGKVL